MSAAGETKQNPRLLAMNWLARREHSLAELRAKLAAKQVDPELIDSTVRELVDDGLASDERFAESFVAARMRKGQGPVRIRVELHRRGVDNDLTQRVVFDAEADWGGLAREVRARKFGEQIPEDYEEKARQMRFLQYRGFSSEHIRAALGGGMLERTGDGPGGNLDDAADNA